MGRLRSNSPAITSRCAATDTIRTAVIQRCSSRGSPLTSMGSTAAAAAITQRVSGVTVYNAAIAIPLMTLQAR